MNKGIWAVVALLVAAVVTVVVVRKQQSESESPNGGATTQASMLTIVVIPKGTSHAYWKSVEAGADQAGKDLGVTIIYKGPVQEDDRAGQISLVEQFITDNVSGIVLAPLDDTALLPPVQSATQKKIPVIIIDSALKGDVGKDFLSYVGTNNRLAGKMGGDELAKILGGQGKYFLLRYVEGSASTTDREQGFLDAMAQNAGLKPVMDNFLYGGASVSEAQKTSMNLLDKIQSADGIFCPNESSTLGMLNVLEQNNLTGKKHFVGFDATPPLVEALKKGEIDALVSQDPTKMGYEGVKACVGAIRGQAPQPNIDSGVQLITRDNLNTPEVQKLLSGG
ncbi:MAG: substrate-binding domain-containing protein [Tepidisphaeraceae bacterium]